MALWNDSIGSWIKIILILLVFAAALIIAWRARKPILDLWNDIYASWTRISKFGKHAILAFSLSITVALIGLACGWFAKFESREWLCQYDAQTYPDCPELLAVSATGATGTPSPTPIPEEPGQSPSTTPSLSPPLLSAAATPDPSPQATPSPTPVAVSTPVPLTGEQKERLGGQARKVKGLVRHHASVMAFFSQAYYTAICVMLFAGALLAMAMFFVGTKGWSQTNEYVRTVFVVMAATVAFYGLWPPVFQQEKNLSDNKALFLEYQTLQNEISSYPVTRTNVKNEAKAPNDFINYIDSEMARLGNIAIGFDYTKITYKGAFESSKSNTPAPSPTPTPKKTP